MTRLAAIFLSVVYAPLGLYSLYKALDIGIAVPPVEDAGNAFWIGVGLMSLIIVGMSVFYLMRSAAPVDKS